VLLLLLCKYVCVKDVRCELMCDVRCECGVVVSHILEDLYNLARSSGPPVVGIEGIFIVV